MSSNKIQVTLKINTIEIIKPVLDEGFVEYVSCMRYSKTLEFASKWCDYGSPREACCKLVSVTIPLHSSEKSASTLSKVGQLCAAGCALAARKIKQLYHGPTGEEIVKNLDMSGKTCLITGGNSGIGLEMVKCLNQRNCNIVMACRNSYEANMVTKQVCQKPNLISIYETNLASLKSVKSFADNINKEGRKIDILILNAGVFGLPWTLTEDGLETIFQVNYLSQYYLLQNIERLLTFNARVIFMSSESHRNIRWPLDRKLAPQEEHLSLPKNEYTSIRAYNISKLCGILSMHYLAYRWMKTGKSVFCAHPGSFIKTKLCRNWWVYEMLYKVSSPFSKTIAQAASTPLYCAVSPELNGTSGLYIKDLKQCEQSDLAQDAYLSFKINDLTRMIIRDRVAVTDRVLDTKADTKERRVEDQNKNTLEETLIST